MDTVNIAKLHRQIRRFSFEEEDSIGVLKTKVICGFHILFYIYLARFVSTSRKDVFSCRFLCDFCNCVLTFCESLSAMTNGELHAPECTGRLTHLLHSETARSHLRGRNIEIAGCWVECRDTIGIPKDSSSDIHVES